MEAYGGTFGEEQGLLKIKLQNAVDPDNPTTKEFSNTVKNSQMLFKLFY